jgi:acetyl-CoA carboxylase beta subunit
VIEQTTGVSPPKDSHRAETLLGAGLIDIVVARKDLSAVTDFSFFFSLVCFASALELR